MNDVEVRLRAEIEEYEKERLALTAELAHEKKQSNILIEQMANLAIQRDKLRELVNAVKDPTEDGGCFGSIYCEDIEGVNWFDARDALKGGET